MIKLKKFVSMILCTFLLGAFLLMPVNKVYAAEVDFSVPKIGVEKYEVSYEKIVPGEDFTLTITLKNYSQKQAADDVIIDITNPSGVAPVYGTVSQVYVGDFAAGESKEISIDYNSATSIVGDSLDFYVTILASQTQNYIVLRVPVGSDSPFSIIATNVPTTATVNEAVTAAVTFKVLGDENVSNVAMKLSANGVEVVNNVIGIMTPGSTKTQALVFSLEEKGEYTLDIEMTYVDNLGQNQFVTVGTMKLSVAENVAVEPEIDMPINVEEDTDEQSSNILLMGICGTLILILFLIVVIVARKKK